MGAAKTQLYDRDFYEWAMASAALLRERRIGEIDLDHVAEEIESPAISERKELQPRKPDNRSWLTSILNQRIKLEQVLEESPSLRWHLDEAVTRAYSRAVRLARTETGEKDKPLPECLWTAGQLLDADFLP